MNDAGDVAPMGRRVAVGCVMTVIGAISGGMVAVLVSKLVAILTRAPSCPDIPTCDWYVYWGVGALLGGVSLPALVLRAMNRPKQASKT